MELQTVDSGANESVVLLDALLTSERALHLVGCDGLARLSQIKLV